MNQSPRQSLEERVSYLEGLLEDERKLPLQPLSQVRFLTLLSLAALAFMLSYLGLGLPNHYYQPMFAAALLALFYQRELLVWPEQSQHYLLPLLNLACLSTLLKLFVGGGVATPLAWLKLPSLEQKVAETKQWYQVTPGLQLGWEPSGISDFRIDITVIQTFLLLLTIVGGFFQFQPFASLTALLLALISIPSLFSLDWDWIIPAMMSLSCLLYLQSYEGRPKASDKSLQP